MKHARIQAITLIACLCNSTFSWNKCCWCLTDRQTDKVTNRDGWESNKVQHCNALTVIILTGHSHINTLSN